MGKSKLQLKSWENIKIGILFYARDYANKQEIMNKLIKPKVLMF